MKKASIIMVFTVLLYCCSQSPQPQEDVGFDFNKFYRKFQAEKAAWESLQLDHYKYTLGAQEGSDPSEDWPQLTITVFPDRDPEITAIDGWPATPESIAELPDEISRVPTITDVYSSLEVDINSYFMLHESPLFKGYYVVYNKTYHYPEYFGIQYTEEVVGGGRPTKITDFENLRK